MAGERTGKAVARVEAAIRRIEQAARPSDARPSDGGTDAALEARYRKLRSQAHAALAEIDGLIGTLEP